MRGVSRCASPLDSCVHMIAQKSMWGVALNLHLGPAIPDWARRGPGGFKAKMASTAVIQPRRMIA